MHRSRLDAWNFGFRKRKLYFSCSVLVAKTKALISEDLRLCFCICTLLVFPCDGSVMKKKILENTSSGYCFPLFV